MLQESTGWGTPPTSQVGSRRYGALRENSSEEFFRNLSSTYLYDVADFPRKPTPVTFPSRTEQKPRLGMKLKARCGQQERQSHVTRRRNRYHIPHQPSVSGIGVGYSTTTLTGKRRKEHLADNARGRTCIYALQHARSSMLWGLPPALAGRFQRSSVQ